MEYDAKFLKQYRHHHDVHDILESIPKTYFIGFMSLRF